MPSSTPTQSERSCHMLPLLKLPCRNARYRYSSNTNLAYGLMTRQAWQFMQQWLDRLATAFCRPFSEILSRSQMPESGSQSSFQSCCMWKGDNKQSCVGLDSAEHIGDNSGRSQPGALLRYHRSRLLMWLRTVTIFWSVSAHFTKHCCTEIDPVHEIIFPYLPLFPLVSHRVSQHVCGLTDTYGSFQE